MSVWFDKLKREWGDSQNTPPNSFVVLTKRGSTACLSKPEPERLDAMVAMIYLFHRDCHGSIVTVSPASLPWLRPGIFRLSCPRDSSEDTIKSHFSDFEGLGMLAVHRVRPLIGDASDYWICTSQTEFRSEQEHREVCVLPGCHPLDPGQHVRMTPDLGDPVWSSFGIPISRIKSLAGDLTSGCDREMLRSITNYEQAREWVTSRGNRNFVTLSDDVLNIVDPEFFRVLDIISPREVEDEESDQYQDRLNIGILFINNVMAMNLSNRNPDYICKIKNCSATDNEPTISHQNYSKEHVRGIMAPAHWKQKQRPSDDEEGAKKQRPKVRKVYWFPIWVESACAARVTSVVFGPWSLDRPPFDFSSAGGPYLSTRTLNTFCGYRWRMEDLRANWVTGKAGRCKDHFLRIISEGFCGGDRALASYIIKWLAFMIQSPERKSKVSVIIKGQKGIGKGLICRLMMIIFGRHYYYLSGVPIGRFNGFLAEKKLVVIDEVTEMNDSIMKALCSETEVSLEKKGVDQRQERNLAEIMMCTNEDVRMKMTEDSRRWLLVQCPFRNPKQMLDWKRYTDQAWSDLFEDEDDPDCGPKAVLFYLLTLPGVREFSPMRELPTTPYMKELIERNLHPAVAWWRFILQRKHLRPSEVEGAPLEYNKFSWSSLFEICRHDETFISLRSVNWKVMREQEFRSAMEPVISANYSDKETRSEFKMNGWDQQVRKWESVYPSVPFH